jgi:selenide, water dikinase
VGPGDLHAILQLLDRPSDPAVLVGTETSDDAGVYRLDEGTAIVCTADFITPVVDDPFLFGQIAAANALSDVYAMAGRPLAALALCVFPKALEPEVAREILAGGQSKVIEAGAAIVGGHTVRGEQLLYGLSVTGRVAPDRIWRNAGARAGDALLFTKPLGSGLIINGLRKEALTLDEAMPTLRKLAELNRISAEVLAGFGELIHAVTDVTGFGLSGHALEMAAASGFVLAIDLDRFVRYPHFDRMVESGVTTAATRANRDNAEGRVVTAATLDPGREALLHDPQTSGGLLVAVAAGAAVRIVDALVAAGVTEARIVGETLALDAARDVGDVGNVGVGPARGPGRLELRPT